MNDEKSFELMKRIKIPFKRYVLVLGMNFGMCYTNIFNAYVETLFRTFSPVEVVKAISGFIMQVKKTQKSRKIKKNQSKSNHWRVSAQRFVSIWTMKKVLSLWKVSKYFSRGMSRFLEFIWGCVKQIFLTHMSKICSALFRQSRSSKRFLGSQCK